jgi:hypothetical protein
MHSNAKTALPSKLERTAFHEAGHAVASHMLDLPIREVNVIAEGGRLGVCKGYKCPSFSPDIDGYDNGIAAPKSLVRIDREIVVLLAGHEAERRYSGRRNHVGARSDNRAAIDLAYYRCGSDAEAQAYLRWLAIRTADLLAREVVRRAVELVASRLLADHKVKGRDVVACYREAALEGLRRRRVTTAEN